MANRNNAPRNSAPAVNTPTQPVVGSENAPTSEGVVNTPPEASVAPIVPVAPVEPKKEKYDFTVGSPQDLRPVELPLVIVGEWKNEAQAEYARILNGYAYSNPEKWEKKKDKLLANLQDLAKNPSRLPSLTGDPEGKYAKIYKNRLTQKDNE